MANYNKVSYQTIDASALEALDLFDPDNIDTLSQIFDQAKQEEAKELRPLEKALNKILPAIKNMQKAGIDVEVFIPQTQYFRDNNITNFEKTHGAVLRLYNNDYFLHSTDGKNLRQTAYCINKHYTKDEVPSCLKLNHMLDRPETHHSFDLDDKNDMHDFLQTILFTAAEFAASDKLRHEISSAQLKDSKHTASKHAVSPPSPMLQKRQKP